MARDARRYLAYGAGAIGTSLFGVVPGLLLLFFMTDTLGIAPGVAGATLFAVKVWDMVADPVVGALSDRTRSRWGRRRPWLFVGTAALPVCFWLLFSVPDFAGVAARWLWVTAWFVAAATAYTVYQVPYVAMPAEMTTDAHEQTVIMAWRMGCMVVGILLAGALAPLLVEWGGGGRAGYARMGAVLGGGSFLALLAALVGTSGAAVVTEGGVAVGALREQLRLAWANRPFRALAGALFVQLTGVSVLLAVVPYFARYVLDGSGATVTRLFVCLVAPALVGMPLWTMVGRRVGKRAAYAAAVTLYALFGLAFAVATPERMGLLYPAVAAMGLAYAGTQVFPFAMLPDVIQAGTAATGITQAGALSGCLTASEQCGNALGALIAGAILAASGFVESTSAPAMQPPGAIAGIRLAASVVPSALLLASLPLLWRCRL